MMNVVFIPYYDSNPYQKLLIRSLSKKSVFVYTIFSTSYYPFSLILKVLFHWKPQILHIHWLHHFLLSDSWVKTFIKSVFFISELVVVKLLGIKIVWTVHNVLSHDSRFIRLELFFTKIISRFCSRIIVHGDYVKSKVIKLYGVDHYVIRVIPHGHYIGYYRNEVSKKQARDLLKLDEREFVFLYFGMIRPYKGVIELIEAFKRLKHTGSRLLIVGKPVNKDIAECVLKECRDDKRVRVVFDFVPDDEVQIYMNAADIVVLPYRESSTSGSLVLSMSFSKPVIAPSIRSITEILHPRGGIVYDPSDKCGLVGAMRQALTSKLSEMGKYNLEIIRNFGWDYIANETYRVYMDCLDGG